MTNRAKVWLTCILCSLGYIVLLIFSWEHRKTCPLRKEITPKYNTDTLELAKLMFSECSICPIEETLLTGSVVINRLRDGRWGNSIHEVIHCENQFHGTKGNNWIADSLHYQLARFLMIFGPIDSRPLYFYGKTDKQFVNKLNLLYKQKYHIFAQ